MRITEWLITIAKQAGITPSSNQTSYYPNIDANHKDFAYLQAASEFGIVEKNLNIDEESLLTRDFAAYTIFNALQYELSDTYTMKDFDESNYPNQAQAVIDKNWFTLDKGYFYPQELVEEEKAMELIDQLVYQMNHRDFPIKNDIQIKDSVQIPTIEPLQIGDHEIVVQTQEWHIGDWVHYFDEGQEVYKRVKEIQEKEDGTHLLLEDVPYEELFESIEVQGEEELDLSKAQILEPSFTIAPSHLKSVALKTKQKTYHIQGFTVVLRQMDNGLYADVSKDLPFGAEFFGQLKLQGIKVKYKWGFGNAYFRVDARTVENIGVRYENKREYFAKLDDLNARDFLNTITNLWHEKKEEVDVEFELCTLKIPLANVPTMTVVAKLLLKMYTDGRAELSLSQSHGLLMEIRNGSLRHQHDFDHQENARIQAEVGLVGSTRFGLEALGQTLMDMSLEAGAKANLGTQVQRYENDTWQTQDSEVAYDFMDEATSYHPDLSTCGRLEAFWILNARFNSGYSVLGKMGLGFNIDLLQGQKLPLLKGLHLYLKNGQFVSSCAVNTRPKSIVLEELPTSEAIEIQTYNMIVHLNETKPIIITGLPKGYTAKDLVYTSSKEDIATVNKDGLIMPKESGSTEIRIATKDNAYFVQCHVLVPMKTT